MAGKGNYPAREAKKPKVGAKKPKGSSSILIPSPAVEVIKKERKSKRTESERLGEE